MDSSTSILQLISHFIDTNVWIKRFILMLFHAVDPDIDISVCLFSWKFSQRHILLFPWFPFEVSSLFTKSFCIFSSSHSKRLTVMIYIYITINIYLHMSQFNHRTAIHEMDTGCNHCLRLYLQYRDVLPCVHNKHVTHGLLLLEFWIVPYFPLQYQQL